MIYAERLQKKLLILQACPRASLLQAECLMWMPVVAVDVTSTEELSTIAGTWSINEYIAKAPVMDGSIAMNSLFAIPGYYLVEESSATSAGNLEWFLENFMANEKLEEGQDVYDSINKKSRQCMSKRQ